MLARFCHLLSIIASDCLITVNRANISNIVNIVNIVSIVNMGSQEIWRDLKRSQGISRDHEGSQEILKEPQRFQGISRDLKGYQEIPRDFKRSQGISRDLMGSQGISRDLKGSQGISRDLERSQRISGDLIELNNYTIKICNTKIMYIWRKKIVKSALLAHLLGPILGFCFKTCKSQECLWIHVCQ